MSVTSNSHQDAALPVLVAKQVYKGFFNNPVLKGVDIALQPGRIHALLGENGAGKSTLINLLSGALAPDSGEIILDGVSLSRLNPAEARAAGIAVVQQELSLTAELSILENIGLGAYQRRFGLIDYKKLHDEARIVCERVGLTEPLETPVGKLSLGRRQMVEIAKALYRNPRVLILDEPTSSLSAHEAGILSNVILKLRDEGVSLLYISHRLNEIRALCTHVTVLKDGVVTADTALSSTDSEELVRLMVGRDAGDIFPVWRDSSTLKKLVQVKGFSAGLVKDISLEACAGEIVGIGGLVGQGQEDLLLGLYGAMAGTAEFAKLNGNEGLFKSVRAANEAGFAYVPADRKKEGLVLPHSIASNLLLPTLDQYTRYGFRHKNTENSAVAALVKRFTIKGDTNRPVQALSGGNQQKVALAKWLPMKPEILLLNDPTRGVDMETKREIYLMLRQFADEGKLILLLSSDTPELVHLCDRVMVFREGKLVDTINHADLSEEAIVGAAMGLRAEGKVA